MATFSLFSIHWSFGLVAATVVLVAFAVAILAILVLILANVFNCCYDLCYNLRHAASEDGLPRTLDDVAPPSVYSDGTAPRGCRPDEDDDDNACAICLDELEVGAEVRVLPRCKHTFHRSCIDQWLGVRSEICPLCRDHVVDIEKPCDQISIEISILAVASDI